MELKRRKKTLSDIIFFFFIVLFAISISMYITFYGSSSFSNVNAAETAFEVMAEKAININVTNFKVELLNAKILNNEIQNNVILNNEILNNELLNKEILDKHILNKETIYIQKSNTVKSDPSLELYSLISSIAFPNSRCYQAILFVIINIFSAISGIFLPDEWTLVNQMVRLDD